MIPKTSKPITEFLTINWPKIGKTNQCEDYNNKGIFNDNFPLINYNHRYSEQYFVRWLNFLSLCAAQVNGRSGILLDTNIIVCLLLELQTCLSNSYVFFFYRWNGFLSSTVLVRYILCYIILYTQTNIDAELVVYLNQSLDPARQLEAIKSSTYRRYVATNTQWTL